MNSELGISFLLKAALRSSIKASGLSRSAIADQMNAILESMDLDKEVTLDQINSWTKNEEGRTIPLILLPIFCRVTKSFFPFQVLLEPLGARIMTKDDEPFLELGRAEAMKRSAWRLEKVALDRLGLNHEADLKPRE